MGKRQTVKTGEKKLYKGKEVEAPKKKGDDDNMYNEIDRYHNEKDDEFLRLDRRPEEQVDDDGYADKEAVMDLAGGVSSSEEEDDDASEDEDEKQNYSDEEEEQEMSSDDDDDDLEMDDEAVTDWGRKKASYFGGDTADLEIGQNEDDAYLEEEAAKEVQSARYEQMDEDDFVLSDNEDENEKPSSQDVETVQSSRDLKKLSRAAKRKLLQSHHPELIPLVTHFSDVVNDWNERTSVVANALFSSNDVSPEVSLSHRELARIHDRLNSRFKNESLRFGQKSDARGNIGATLILREDPVHTITFAWLAFNNSLTFCFLKCIGCWCNEQRSRILADKVYDTSIECAQCGSLFAPESRAGSEGEGHR